MNIIVLAGGISPERNVSFASGANIAAALEAAGHRAKLLDMFLGAKRGYKSFDEFYFDEKSSLGTSFDIGDAAPDIDALYRLRPGKSIVGPYVMELLRLADIVFIALHGNDGEDGRLQAALDLERIRYTGSRYLACALTMDKEFAKRLLTAAGIKMPDGICLKNGQFPQISPVGLPCVVKPCRSGSSIGVSIVREPEAFHDALLTAYRYSSSILVEEFIKGRETAVGLLDSKPLPPIEIVPKEGFFDYRNKYSTDKTDEICPAQMDSTIIERQMSIAKRVNDLLGLKVYSRIDFIVRDDGEIFCLEANALPGMTQSSLLPKEALATGIAYPKLCDTIVKLSMECNFDE